MAKRAGVSHAAPAHHFGEVRGLLTALAAVGYRRLVAAQQERQKKAARKGAGGGGRAAAQARNQKSTQKSMQEGAQEGAAQLAATGLGYIDFAMAHPALFRLMFSSDQPDFQAGDLERAARIAFEKLLEDVGRFRNADPRADESAMAAAMATWAMVQGLADLLKSGRIKYLQKLPKQKREAVLSEMILRAAS